MTHRRYGALLLVGIPAAWSSTARTATSGTPGVAVPLYALDGTCSERHFPRLAGEWAVGCSRQGRIDRAVHLPDGRIVELDPSLDPARTAVSAGTTSDALVLVELDGRTRVVDVTPHGATDRDGVTRLPAAPIAPPAGAPEHFAAALPDRIEALAYHARVRPTFKAHPVGWYAPALAWPHVAWVERSDAAVEQVWTVQAAPPGEPRLLSEGPGHQRHVVSDGRHIAWVAPGRLEQWTPSTGARTSLPADTGFHAPPTISDGVVCWEERREPPGGARPRPDIDILCSDGMEATGPGDQLWPSRSGPWLLYRADGHTWLKTAS